MKEDEKDIFSYALRLLSRKAYSEKVVRNKLEAKFSNPQKIQKVVDKLRQLGYLNDFKVVQALCHKRVIDQLRGPKRIIGELARKGFSKEDIQKALDNVLKEQNEIDTLEKAAKKWLLKKGDVNSFKELKRLEGFLIRKGFRIELIREYIGKIEINN